MIEILGLANIWNAMQHIGLHHFLSGEIQSFTREKVGK
jgi:hypothetical protein